MHYPGQELQLDFAILGSLHAEGFVVEGTCKSETSCRCIPIPLISAKENKQLISSGLFSCLVRVRVP